MTDYQHELLRQQQWEEYHRQLAWDQHNLFLWNQQQHDHYMRCQAMMQHREHIPPVDDAAPWTLPTTRQDDKLTTADKKPVSATAESSSVQKDTKGESGAKKSGNQSPSRRRPDTDSHTQRAHRDNKETPPAQVEALRSKLNVLRQSPKVKAVLLRNELKNMTKSVDGITMRRILEKMMCVWQAKTPHGAKELVKQHGSEIDALAHLMTKNELIKLTDVRKMVETESKHQPKKKTKKKKLKKKKKSQEAASVHAEEPKKKRRRKMKSKATDKKTTLEKPVDASKKPDRDHETQPEQRQKVQTKNRAPLTNPQDVLRSQELGSKSIGQKRRTASAGGRRLNDRRNDDLTNDKPQEDAERHSTTRCDDSTTGECRTSEDKRSNDVTTDNDSTPGTATSQRHGRHGLSGVEFEDEDWAPKENETDDMRHKIENMMKRVTASTGRRQGKCQADWGGPTDGHDQDTDYLVKDDDRKPSPEVLKQQMLRDEQLCFEPPPKMKLRPQWEKQIKRTLSTGGQGQTTRDKRSTVSTTGNDSTTRKVTTQRQDNSTLRITICHDRATTQQHDSTAGKQKYQHGGRYHRTSFK